MKTDLALSGDVAAVVAAAGEQARKARHEFVGPEHVLLAMLDSHSEGVLAALNRKHLNRANLREALTRRIEAGPDEVASGRLPMSPEGCDVLEEASRIARRHRRGRLTVTDLLDATLNHGGVIGGAVAATR